MESKAEDIETIRQRYIDEIISMVGVGISAVYQKIEEVPLEIRQAIINDPEIQKAFPGLGMGE
jgi:uncharacterized protein YdeI (YjbR/CyaY-like superfamily)